MTPTLPTTRMTAAEFADYCDLPENADKTLELVRGEVVEVPSPTKLHGRVCFRVGFVLETYATAVGGGYVVSNDSGIILERNPDTVRGPDIAFFTDVTTHAEVHPKWSETPPVLAVEVLSPSDKMPRVVRKVGDYLTAGVAVVWLVDYEEKCVTVYRMAGGPQVFGVGQTITCPELPGFAAEIAEFFRLPGEKSP